MINLNQTPNVSGTIVACIHVTCSKLHVIGGINVSGVVKGTTHVVGAVPHVLSTVGVSGKLHNLHVVGAGRLILPAVAAGGVAYSTPNGITFPLLGIECTARFGDWCELMPLSVSGRIVVGPPPLRIGITLPLLHATGIAAHPALLNDSLYRLPMVTATCKLVATIGARGAVVLPNVRMSCTVITPKNNAVLPKLSVTAILTRPKSCQGSVALRRINISGGAIISKVYTLLKPVVHASLQTVFTHTTGTYRLNSVTATGHATHFAASGKCQLPKLRTSGRAARTVRLAAVVRLPKASVRGSFGWGASVVLHKAQLHASVTAGRTLRGSCAVPRVRVSGVVVAALALRVSVRMYKPKVYGSITINRRTTGVCKFKAVRTVGAVKVGKTVAAAYPLPIFKLASRAVFISNIGTIYALRKAVVKGAMVCHLHT
jgi:hypothetical protein